MSEALKIYYIDEPMTKRGSLARACDIAGISMGCCVGEGRHKDVVRRRWHVMAILSARGPSTAEIGRRLNRDHTTVMHGLRRWAQIQAEKVAAE